MAEPAHEALGPPSSTGPLHEAMAGWQTPPPAHGSTYELYETVEQAETEGSPETIKRMRWVDAATKLLLHERVVAGSEVQFEAFYTFELERRTTAEMPADVFAVPAPPEGGETTDYAFASSEDEEVEEDPPTYEARYAESQEWRALFGFSTADEVIRATLALEDTELADSVDDYGVPLTPSEQAEMELRAAVEDSADIIDAYVAEAAANAYGGMWLDHQGGGVVRVGFTEDADGHLTALRDRFPYPDRLRTFTATRTVSELQSVADAILTDKADLAANGINLTTLGVREDLNEVEVGATDWPQDKQDYMTSRYGGALHFETIEAPVPAGSRYSWPIPPVWGGLRITSPKPSRCSTGFTVAKPQNIFVQRILTAGHCANRGTPFRHKDGRNGKRRFIGRVSARLEALTIDAALIKPSRFSFGIDRILLRPRRDSGEGRYLRIRSSGSPRAGGTTCYVGYKHPSPRCGYRIFDDLVTGQPCGQYTFRKRVRPGDSGGPVYRKGKAYGLVSSGNDSARRMCWSPIRAIEDRFNVRVIGAIR